MRSAAELISTPLFRQSATRCMLAPIQHYDRIHGMNPSTAVLCILFSCSALSSESACLTKSTPDVSNEHAVSVSPSSSKSFRTNFRTRDLPRVLCSQHLLFEYQRFLLTNYTTTISS